MNQPKLLRLLTLAFDNAELERNTLTGLCIRIEIKKESERKRKRGVDTPEEELITCNNCKIITLSTLPLVGQKKTTCQVLLKSGIKWAITVP